MDPTPLAEIASMCGAKLLREALGVKVSPLPQPNILANVTPLRRRSIVRSIDMRNSAKNKCLRLIFQK
jgi:hypothetical protein